MDSDDALFMGMACKEAPRSNARAHGRPWIVCRFTTSILYTTSVPCHDLPFGSIHLSIPWTSGLSARLVSLSSFTPHRCSSRLCLPTQKSPFLLPIAGLPANFRGCRSLPRGINHGSSRPHATSRVAGRVVREGFPVQRSKTGRTARMDPGT